MHAFPATNAKGETRFIKFKVEPVGQELTLTADKEANSADFLNDDLTLRIAARDVRFSVMALLGFPGDPVMDVIIRWPDEDEREAVRLGQSSSPALKQTRRATSPSSIRQISPKE